MPLSARGQAILGIYASFEADHGWHLGKHGLGSENFPRVNNLYPVSNSVSLRLVRERLATLPDLPSEELTYDYMCGSKTTRELIAHFLATKLPEYSISSDQVVVLDGPTSILNAIAVCLCEEGDRVLVPFECRGELSFRLAYRAKVEAVPVYPNNQSSVCDKAQNLEATWQKSGAGSSRIRMVYVAFPDAHGTGVEPGMLDHIVTWASSRGLHTIADITNALGISADMNTLSSWDRIASRENVHIIWDTSKFFNIPGASLCALMSGNKAMLKVLNEKLSYFGSTSRHSQWIIQHMLSDSTFVDRYMEENRRNLTIAHHLCAEKLDKMGIPHRFTHAGCPILLYLDDGTKDNPGLRSLISENDILVSTSDSNSEHVFLYYAAATSEELDYVIQSLRTFIPPSS